MFLRTEIGSAVTESAWVDSWIGVSGAVYVQVPLFYPTLLTEEWEAFVLLLR